MDIRPILWMLGFLAFTSSAQAQNLVNNGGFEAGFSGWTSSGWIAGNSPTSAPRTGTIQAYSNCGAAGQSCTLSQAIAITPGRYTFSVYAISPNSNPATFSGSFTATIGGQTLYNGQFTSGTGLNTNNTNYQLFTGNFTLNASSTTIFFSGGNNQGDLAIDDVSLVRIGNVPEPATWTMMILGFGIVGGTLRRRRRAPATGTGLLATA